MVRCARALLVLLAATLWAGLWAGAGMAQDPMAPGAAQAELFDVRDIQVDVTAATAAAAREQAQAKGARAAFLQLLDRLTLATDRAKLSKVSDSQIETMIKDFSVADEKYSSVRYLATLSYTFKETDVRDYLARQGVAYALTRAKPIVVVPVLRGEGSLALWDDPNPWRAAWANLPAGQLVPVLVPLGDVTDVGIIDAEQAAIGDEEKLAQLAARYDADGSLVPFAVLTNNGATGLAEMTVALTLYGVEGARKGPTRRYRAEEGESVDELFGRAAAATMGEIQSQWKRENLVTASHAAVESVAIPLTGLDDWTTIRKRLERVQTIEKTEVVLLSRSMALVNIHHFGTAEQLGLALEQADLTLRQGAQGLVLTLRGNRS